MTDSHLPYFKSSSAESIVAIASSPESDGLLAQRLLTLGGGMAAIRRLALQQLELARICDVQSLVGSSVLRKLYGELRSTVAGQLAAVWVVGVDGLSGEVDGRIWGSVRACICDQRLHLAGGSTRLRKDADLDPHSRWLPVARGLLVKELPRGRVVVCP